MNRFLDFMVRISERVYLARKGQITSLYNIDEIANEKSGK